MGLTTDTEDVPVRLVGSSVFGRYPTISPERTYNLFISSSGDGEEEWLVNFPGYREVLNLIAEGAEGRGIYHSVRGNFILAVAGADVFRIDQFSSSATNLGAMTSSTGEVFFDENLSSQICFVDGTKARIYNYLNFPAAFSDAVFDAHSSDFQPNYVIYHNTYFIFGNALTTNAGSNWVIYESGADGMSANAYKLTWVQTLALQTKPDFAKAVLRIPGKGNNIIVFGTTVAEIWSNVGGAQVYQRNSSVNIDYGAASVATIAASEEVVAWLGINEKSSPALMVMEGGNALPISTDGLDALLETVDFPADSTAILYREGGHLFYIITFFNPADDFSIMYDFKTKKLFDLTDWDFTAYPARQVVYFGNKTYFLNFKNGCISEISSNITTYDVLASSENMDYISYDIPQIRISNTHRVANRPEKFKIKLFTFVMESGTTPNTSNQMVCEGYIITEDTSQVIYTEDGHPILTEAGFCTINLPRVDLTISKNGGITYSNTVSYLLKATADYQNQPRFNNLGYAQQINYQMRFWGSGRKVIKNGTMEIGN